MKNWEEFDKVVRDGVQTEYPYDEALWKNAEKALDARQAKSTTWLVVPTLLILAISLVSVLRYDKPISNSNEIASNNTSVSESTDHLLTNPPTSQTTSTTQEKITEQTNSTINEERTTIDITTSNAGNKTVREHFVQTTPSKLSSPNKPTPPAKPLVETGKLDWVDVEYVDLNLTPHNNLELRLSNDMASPNITAIKPPPYRWFTLFALADAGLMYTKSTVTSGDGLNQKDVANGFTQHMALGVNMNGWTLGAGLGRAAWTVNTSLNNWNYTTVTDSASGRYELLNNNYNHQGNNVALIGKQYDSRIDSNLTTTREKFGVNYVMVPISAGYEFTNKRWVYGLNATQTFFINGKVNGNAGQSLDNLLSSTPNRFNTISLQAYSRYRITSAWSAGVGLAAFRKNQGVDVSVLPEQTTYSMRLKLQYNW